MEKLPELFPGDPTASDTKRIVSLRAFRVKARGFDIAGIYWAENASKARNMSRMAANDAGYNFEYKDLKVRRAPEFDELYSKEKNGCGEDYLEELLAN